MTLPRVLIICPALANANNGNWLTAWRWSKMLSKDFVVSIAQEWNGEPCDVMLALHAKRSAASIKRFVEYKFLFRDKIAIFIISFFVFFNRICYMCLVYIVFLVAEFLKMKNKTKRFIGVYKIFILVFNCSIYKTLCINIKSFNLQSFNL